MLAELQQSLVDLYRVDHGYDLKDYLITDASLARVLAQDSLLPTPMSQSCCVRMTTGSRCRSTSTSECLIDLMRQTPLNISSRNN